MKPIVQTLKRYSVLFSPSLLPKAEPFKQWLAKVGYERVQEIENPELAQDRMKSSMNRRDIPKVDREET